MSPKPSPVHSTGLRGTYLCISHEECQAEAAEAGFEDEHAGLQLLPDDRKRVVTNPQESKTVRAGALAPRSSLNAKEIIQQRAHEVVVQVPASNQRGNRGSAVGGGKGEQ